MKALTKVTVAVALMGACTDPGGLSTSEEQSPPDHGGSDGGLVGEGGWGVTPGGAQDFNYVRDVIEQGGVPAASDIRTEGLLSEHDLTVEGPPCEHLVCVRPATAVATDLASSQLATWVLMSFASGLPEDFERPPLDLTVLIDKSSSMSIDMAETNEAVVQLLGQLRADDRIGIYAFDSTVHTVHAFGPVGDETQVEQQVRAVQAGGGWDIFAALDHGYSVLSQVAADSSRLRRVVVLSCGYPSASDPRFVNDLGAAADAGIATSFVGVLLGYDGALAQLLGQTRGGSYHYTGSLEEVESVFGADFVSMVTPLAYDMDIGFLVDGDYQIERFYGLPSADPGGGNGGDGGGDGGDGGGDGGGDSGHAGIATGFLSRRGGGIVGRLSLVDEPANSGNLAGAVTLSYEPEPALAFPPYQAKTTDIGVLSPGEPHFETSSARKAVALVNMAERMMAACSAYHGQDAAEAIAILDTLIDHMTQEVTALDDDADLAAEVVLLQKLRSNIEASL